jgi:predicted nucleic acid-binding protein
MKVLLDSCTLIDLLRGKPNAIQTVEGLRKEGAVLHLSTLNSYEVLCGVMALSKDRERNQQAFDLLAANLGLLMFDSQSARCAAEIWAQQRMKGKPLDGLDCLIVGCAVAQGIDAIVTRNKKHFENIRGIKKVIAY